MAVQNETVPSWRIDVILLFIAVAVVLYLYVTWHYTYWKIHGVPYVKPTFLFGNIFDSVIRSKALGIVYQDIYRKLEGQPYGGFFKFRQPALMLRDPELIRSVLVKQFPSFHDNEFKVAEEVDPMSARNPHVQQEERWKTTRNLLTPFMTVAEIRPLFPLIMEICKEAVQYLEKLPDARSPGGVDTKELASQFTTDLIASSVFGLRGNSFKDPESNFWVMSRNIVVPSLWKDLQIYVLTVAPKVAEFLGLKVIDDEVADFFYRAARQVVLYRDEHCIERADFMQVLMQIRNGNIESSDKINTDYGVEDIAAYGTMFFTEGCQTSSTALAFTLFELAQNTELQEKLREEVLHLSEGELSYEKLQEMKLLDQIICESLRKYPPVMFITRLCTRSVALPTPGGGSYQIDVGTPVVIPVYALHHDPEYYNEPDDFDPERFSEVSIAARHRFVFLPFGEGPRICIGMKFALALVKAAVATIVKKFNLRTCPRTVTSVTPSPHYSTLCAKDGLRINFFSHLET